MLRILLLLLALLAICSPCFAQQKASEVIQSELIDAPESVAVGRLVSIKLPADLPFTVEPTPANKLSFIDEETGKRAYLILEAKAPGYTITIDYAVVHPTDEEIEAAPWDDREKFKSWLKSQEGRADEIYRDEHFVKVGAGPDPDPDPDPEPDPDPTPTPAPIPEPGFRVFIFYEKDDALPPASTGDSCRGGSRHLSRESVHHGTGWDGGLSHLRPARGPVE